MGGKRAAKVPHFDLKGPELQAALAEAMGALTALQRSFVDNFLIDLNTSKAAERAGYSSKTAYAAGSRLMAKNTVGQAIGLAMAARAERNQMDSDWVLAQLREILEMAKEKTDLKSANRALELIGKHLSMFVDRVDHTSKGEKIAEAPKQVMIVNGKEVKF